MIYEMLLVQEGGMFIPCDVFARRNYKRGDSIPYECGLCGLVFLSREGCDKHIANRHHRHTSSKALALSKPLLPDVSTSLLQTCRIIRHEASPILYLRNSFHFCDSATARNFRWATDCAQAGAIQELGIKFSPPTRDVNPWQTRLTKGSLSLAQDFPKVRRLTIDLSFRRAAESFGFLRSMSKGLRETSQGLDWVLVLQVRSIAYDRVLDCFEQLVAKKDDPTKGKKEVRRHVWTRQQSSQGKDALLWWGSPGEAVPHKYRAIGDQPQQEASS